MDHDRDEDRFADGDAAAAPPAADPDAILRCSGLARLAFAWGGVVVPPLCFLVAIPLGPAYRYPPGSTAELVWALLSPPGALPNYPLLLYNIICMVQMLVAPAHFAGNRMTRFGIYTGVVYAAEYWILLPVGFTGTTGFNWGDVAFFLFVVVPSFALIGFLILAFFGSLALIFGLAAVATWKDSPLIAMIPGLIALIIGMVALVPWALVSLPLGPTMALVAYGAMSIQLLRWRWARGARFRYSLAELCGLMAWWSVHLALWRISFLLAQGGAGSG
jgi:hypothetical protein